MTRILIDTFFHMMPGHRIARNISVGGYVTNFGRYTTSDLYHPNGASMLYSDLVADYDVEFSNQPFSELTLCGADLLIVPNPDYPMYEGASPYRIDHWDVEALMNFLNRGGSVLLLVNSFLQRSDFWEENFDYERINPLFEQLGIRWDPNYMSDDSVILPAVSGEYIVGYGQGGRVLGDLPDGAQALLRWENETYGFVKQVGRGKVAVIGDAGLISNGLYGFPTFENRAFLLDLIDTLAPKNRGRATEFEKTTFGHLSCATFDEGINERLFQSLRPDAVFKRDHHYRHLTWESAPEAISADTAELPFELKDLENKSQIILELPLVAIEPGLETKRIPMTLNVAANKKGDSTEYLVTGTTFTEGLNWEDIGASAERFEPTGSLLRVNSIVQYQLAEQNGVLMWAALKQGQIFYASNAQTHYGYNIMLASNNTIYSPIRNP